MRKIHDPKIESFLDALGDEYKALLLEELIEESDSIDTLSISKLVSIDADIKRYVKQKRESKKYRRLQLYGMLYICMGLFLLFMSEIFANFRDLDYLAPESLIQMMALVLCLVGTMASISPILFRNKKKTNNTDNQRKLIEYEVITTWRELEAICTDLSLKSKTVSNKSVIQLLAQEQLVSEEEEKELVSFLKIRNAIIHSSNNKPTDVEMRDGIKKAMKIKDAIYKRILPDKQ